MSDLTSNAGVAAPVTEEGEALRALVRQLAEILGVQHAFLGRIVAGGSGVETVAAWMGDRYDTFAYDLAGSPCANVVQTGVCVYPRDVARLFPDDVALAQLAAESYAGILVRDEDGEPKAVLAGLGTEPLEPHPEIEATLRLFAARARAALDRLDARDEGYESATVGRRAADRLRGMRDEILIAVADGGERLLRTEPWTHAAPEVLELLARAAGVDRAALLAVDRDRPDGPACLSERFVWSADGPGSEIGVPSLDGWEENLGQLVRGEIIDRPWSADAAGSSGWSARTLLLPIRVRGELCGLVRLDDLGRREAWTANEREALRAAGGVFGAAVDRDRTARDLRARERILHAIALSAESLLSATTWREVIPAVLESLGRAIEASRAFVCESRVEPSGQYVSTLTYEWVDEGVGPSDIATWTNWIELPGHVERLLAGSTTRHLASTATGATRDGLLGEGTQSEINVPILVDGALLGYLGFDDCFGERVWSDAEEEALHIGAGLIGNAMARERGADALERRERVLEAVAAAGAILLDSASWRTCIDQVLAAIGLASDADRAQLFEATHGDASVRVSLSHLWARNGDVSELANPVWQGYELSPDAIEHFVGGHPVSERADGMPEPARSAMEGSGTLSFTSLPVHVQGRLWGLIGLDDTTTGRTWSPAENEALRAAASMLGAAVERTLTDEMLRASEAQLRQAQKMEAVGRLASGVAHDFNNILTGIGGFAMLLAERTDGDAKRYADSIVEATEHAATLVQQLLAVGRPSPASPERIDVGEVVTSLEGILRRLAGEQIELAISVDSSAPPVLVDGSRLRQVVLNLVANAVDSIDEAGSVAIAVERGRDGSSTRLVVRDTGCGMDSAALSNAFEPFVTTKTTDVHAGLGLSIVYGIVQAAGGTVALESEPDRGTRAIVSLPAASA